MILTTSIYHVNNQPKDYHYVRTFIYLFSPETPQGPGPFLPPNPEDRRGPWGRVPGLLGPYLLLHRGVVDHDLRRVGIYWCRPSILYRPVHSKGDVGHLSRLKRGDFGLPFLFALFAPCTRGAQVGPSTSSKGPRLVAYMVARQRSNGLQIPTLLPMFYVVIHGVPLYQ